LRTCVQPPCALLCSCSVCACVRVSLSFAVTPCSARVDLGALWLHPLTKDGLVSNVEGMQAALRAADLPLMLDSVDVLLGPEDDDVMLLQVLWEL
jgi:hypothetical protein